MRLGPIILTFVLAAAPLVQMPGAENQTRKQAGTNKSEKTRLRIKPYEAPKELSREQIDKHFFDVVNEEAHKGQIVGIFLYKENCPSCENLLAEIEEAARFLDEDILLWTVNVKEHPWNTAPNLGAYVPATGKDGELTVEGGMYTGLHDRQLILNFLKGSQKALRNFKAKHPALAEAHP